MYLKSLTLKGFKSFAKPTTFAFEPGVTCVVGPNGSGKSNVVDALAWVMGEQGAKTLRGGKMEDVIFAGTATTGPLGRAEVVLTIDNSDGALPIEYTEVTIKRTMFRGGGSDYAINGRSCRLLDVQELLSDSGLGREMHVIVGQGQLDAVLRATPEERRGFVEEAAGILKHRRRKEKTVRKLEAMEANLTRLSDLAGEIRRQLKPLGRQAEVAKEAQTIAAVVRDARARILADDVVQLRSAITVHSRTESESTTERIVLQEQLDQARLRVARLEQAQVSDEVDRARTTAFELQAVQEKLRSLFALAGQQLALLGAEPDAPDVHASVSETEVIDAVDEAQRLAEAISAADDRWRDAQAVAAKARAALTALDDEIAQQSALVSRHDLELSQLGGLYDSAVSRVAAIRAEAERQTVARDAAKERCSAAEHALAEAMASAPDEQHNTAHWEHNYRQARDLVAAIEAEIDPLRSGLHTVERERDALAARKSALSSALDQRDGSTAVATSGLDGIRGLVADSVQIAGGWETAIAAALGAIANAVLAEGRAAAIAALSHAAAHNAGRVDVVIADAASGTTAPAPAFEHLPPGVVPAPSVVTAPEGVMGLLEHVVLAEETSVAQQAWAILSDDERRRVTIITRAGEALSHFVLRGGSGAARSKLELAVDRDAAATRLAQVTAEIHHARTALEQRVDALREAKVKAAEALAEVRESDSAAAQRTEKLNRMRVQVEATQGEAQRLERALAVTEEAVADAVAAVARAAAARDEAQSRPRPILDVTARDQLSAELDLAREREVEARLAVDTARERMRVQQLRAEQLRAQREREQAAAEEAARRAVIRRRHQEAAERVLAALPHALEVADASAAEANAALAVAECERAAQNTELTQLRRDEQTLRDKLQQVTESVHALEMQIYEKKLHLSGLLERAGAELGLIEEVLVAEYGPDQPVGDDAAPFVRAEQEHRLARAERTLAQLGRINPLALEEFAALEQRHTFLTEQLTDLTTTRADLLTIVDEIDEKMQGIFADAFADTRTAFNDVFPILFPGGSGSIHLTDPDNMLATGIEVSVKPAGKKIERLSLLSGGERSLAAVALLIAIFKARPSPFYIMDEVEAALDDANLGRLLHIFEDLRDTSQLIIITHQKRTMEIADALYGVSMRQDGVSAVVGQRVNAERAEAPRVHAPALDEAPAVQPPDPDAAPAAEA